ncbi:MAG: hypothetical protein VKJ05_07800 [Synechococcaceae cyanobacterium]|nr:hypothetical protein [Synechococcaceae cyanobacterium]
MPDPLFARLKARAASEGVTLKQLLRSSVEQGLSATPATGPVQRRRILAALEGLTQGLEVRLNR